MLIRPTMMRVKLTAFLLIMLESAAFVYFRFRSGICTLHCDIRHSLLYSYLRGKKSKENLRRLADSSHLQSSAVSGHLFSLLQYSSLKGDLKI